MEEEGIFILAPGRPNGQPQEGAEELSDRAVNSKTFEKQQAAVGVPRGHHRGKRL